MNIRLVENYWVVNSEYIVKESIYGWSVFNNDNTINDDSTNIYSSTYFEDCLVFIWNSL